MTAASNPFPVPDSFPFPYDEPYPIQADFMRALYATISERKVGIFESPTGTGKTLSIICGAFKWLEDHREDYLLKEPKFTKKDDDDRSKKENDQDKDVDNNSKPKLPSWVSRQFQQQKISSKVQVSNQHFKKLKDYEAELDMLRITKKRKYAEITKSSRQNHLPNQTNDEEDSKPPERLKIIFASRTHSQLAQFVSELKKSPYRDKIATVTLAGRSSLCVNDEVKNLKNSNAINEACLDLKNKGKSDDLEEDGDEALRSTENPEKKPKKSKTKIATTTTGCPYHKLTKELNLRHEIMQKQILDLEELVSQGKDIFKACPYYTSRRALSNCELVLVPYNILLHENLRKLSGLTLKDNILIIDEAHNLTEAVANVHATELARNEVTGCRNQLETYLGKYQNRLNEVNSKYLQLLLDLVARLDRQIEKDQFLKPSDFIFEMGISKFNIKLILKWCESTSIGRKLLGTSTAKKEAVKPSAVSFLLETKDEGHEDKENSGPKEVCSRHCLFKVTAFLGKIYSETAEDSRIILNQEGQVYRYLLLNASNVFKSIVEEPRAVVIAGGTMKPVDSFILQLLPEVPKERIKIFSCGHIIDTKNQLLTMTLKSGPTNQLLDYRFFNRSNHLLIQETIRILTNLSRFIPKGMVVFFPSYKLLETYKKSWNVDCIGKKLLLSEPKSASECEKMLKKYENLCLGQANTHNGAVLLSVVGGKLAEGINFNDDLGRAVFIIGQPYPDVKSQVLQEKLKFLKEAQKDQSNYADTLCWRAINQSIGRAIRHRNDYACIVLLDNRYCQPGGTRNLPDWIGDSVVRCEKFGPCLSKVNQFFKKFDNTKSEPKSLCSSSSAGSKSENDGLE